MKQLSKVLDMKVSRFNFSPELSLSQEPLWGIPLSLEDQLVPWNHTELPSRQEGSKIVHSNPSGQQELKPALERPQDAPVFRF